MKTKKGFTLVELLVVMSIIAILSGSLISVYNRIQRSSQRAKAQESVDNLRTSLVAMHQQKGRWPVDFGKALFTYGGKDGSGMGAVVSVARLFAKHGYMGVAYKGSKDDPQLIGKDRVGIVDPWACAILQKTEGAQGSGLNLRVPSGGTVQDHILYFAIDDNGDGIVEATVCGQKIRVRGEAIAWCAGADGKLGSGYLKRTKENADNVYSWTRGQEVK